jgi:hypothetical protein
LRLEGSSISTLLPSVRFKFRKSNQIGLKLWVEWQKLGFEKLILADDLGAVYKKKTSRK